MDTAGFKFAKVPTKKRKNRVRSKLTKERRAMVKLADSLMQEIVKIRDKFTCQRCGRTEAQGYKIDDAHIRPKGKYQRVRYLLINHLALCFLCHDWWHKESEGISWFKEKYPGVLEQIDMWVRNMPKLDMKQLLFSLQIELDEARRGIV